jgi:hypothetical protein
VVEGRGRRPGEWRGQGKGREMTQILHAHVNKRKNNNIKVFVVFLRGCAGHQ